MSASVLFDAPGPKTVARHRTYSIVSILVLVALVAFAVWRLYDRDQLEYALWEPFVTPRIVQAIGEAWLDLMFNVGRSHH